MLCGVMPVMQFKCSTTWKKKKEHLKAVNLQTDKCNCSMGSFIGSCPMRLLLYLPVKHCGVLLWLWSTEGEETQQCQHTELPHALSSDRSFLLKRQRCPPPSCSPTCCAGTDKPPWHCVPVEPTPSAVTVPAPSARGSG